MGIVSPTLLIEQVPSLGTGLFDTVPKGCSLDAEHLRRVRISAH